MFMYTKSLPVVMTSCTPYSQINNQFAIDLVAEEPVVVIAGSHTHCDGGAALGHPRVYINLDKPEIQDCGYCGKRFVSEKNKEQFSSQSLTFVQPTPSL